MYPRSERVIKQRLTKRHSAVLGWRINQSCESERVDRSGRQMSHIATAGLSSAQIRLHLLPLGTKLFLFSSESFSVFLCSSKRRGFSKLSIRCLLRDQVITKPCGQDKITELKKLGVQETHQALHLDVSSTLKTSLQTQAMPVSQ